MARAPRATRTVDVVHVTLESLGYRSDRAGVARIAPVSFAIYRSPTTGVTVTWPADGSACQVSAGTSAAALVLCDALERAGLICERAGLGIHVHGQEHIDAEVRRMLG